MSSVKSKVAPRIALTFDDGPHPMNTRRLLETLNERLVPATFFVLGKNISLWPSLARDVHDGGHEVGNHGWSHRSFANLSDSEIVEELRATDGAIRQLTLSSPSIYRPPYGAISDAQRHLIEAQFAYHLVMWNIDSADWRRPSVKQLVQSATELKYENTILLFHDFCDVTCEGLPHIIEGLLRQNCIFYTVSDLLRLK